MKQAVRNSTNNNNFINFNEQISNDENIMPSCSRNFTKKPLYNDFI